MKKWFMDLKISKKLSLGFLVASAFGLIIGLAGMISIVILTKTNLAGNQTFEIWAVLVMLVLMIISSIASLLLSRYISRIISKPIQKLARFAEMLAVGDLEIDKVMEEKDKRLRLRKDEVGILADSFIQVITGTIEQARETQAIANGDLTTVVAVRSGKDIMGKALSELVEKLHGLVASIVLSADRVNSGAKQVADSSVSLSQGASTQASSVEELTASLEKITSRTTLNAQNAQTTDGLAKNIKKDAEAGNAQMTEMLHAMDDINSSSDNISKIIKSIENIAFQTNILALNAAVEAARAGQYGRGFTVVAEEIRNLAGQSSKAAKETADLIKNSIEKVETGTKSVSETADAFGKIVSGISKVSELVNVIASASNEQSLGLKQINQGIMQVSQIVQSNAAATEECAAASEELSGQAESLKTNVSVFRLNTDGKCFSLAG